MDLWALISSSFFSISTTQTHHSNATSTNNE
jgi:hypothetical protein